MVCSANNPIGLQLFQVLDKHFFANAHNKPPQFTKTAGSAAKVE